MALNASGPISLGGSTAGQSIALELGLSATGQISLNDAAVRTLAGVASGAIVMPTNFWGKANVPTGSLYTWGANGFGVLLDGTTVSRSSPVLASGGSTWTNEGVLSQRPCFLIKSNGTLWCWGDLSSNSSGTGPSTISSSSPIQIGALTNWKTVSIVAQYTGIAVKTDGTLWVWGQNGPFTGLNNNLTSPSSPVQVGLLTNWSTVRGYGDNELAAALKTDSTLWVWGNNPYGSLGTNNTVSYSSPVQVGGAEWADVAVWSNINVQMIKTNGTMWGAGYNTYIGTNEPYEPKSSPVQVGALTNWASLRRYAESYSRHAIKTDKTLWAWGSSFDYGDAGTSARINYSSPVQVGALTDWSYANGSIHGSVFTRTNGTLWVCGSNSGGQLGLNLSATTLLSSRSSPVQIGALTDWKAPIGNIGASRIGAIR